MSTGGVRPGVAAFQRHRWNLSVVDGPAILAAARVRPVELLHGNPFPAPVRRTRLTVSTQDGSAGLQAVVHSGRAPGGPYLTVLGRGPIGTLLRRRVEANDERAVRIVGGLRTAVDRLNRLGLRGRGEAASEWAYGRPIASRMVVDEATGLRTTVTHHAPAAGREAGLGRIVVLQATVAEELMASVHLAAFFDVLAGTVGRIIGHPVEGSFTLAADRPGAGPWRPTLDQVGGLDDIVAQFRDVADSFRHPTVMSRWGARRPQGILLYGPPGTGKTMLARALAEEIDATVREIRTPEILDKWLGSSERNMKRIFREARQYTTPTVMLFDEFDSIISYAGSGSDSGSHAVNAVAGLFKQEMNNLIDANPYVIVVATTNFPALIDASLIRSGRFDVKLEIPLPDARGRAQILTRMIRSLIAEYEGRGFQMFAADLDIGSLAAAAVGMSGADLREVLRRAQLAKAMQEARSGAAPSPIEESDLLAQIKELRVRDHPSTR